MKKTHAVALVLYGFVVVAVFGKALFPPTGWMIFGDDIHHYYYFLRQFFVSFLRDGIFPWWNPYNFSGTPFAANPQVILWYPPAWLFVLLPLNVAYSWYLALHIFWAMVGMYFALRAMSNVKCQMSNAGAWIGGLLFGLSGFFMARVWAGHVDVIAAASWMPLVIMTNVKAQMSKQRKYLVLAAIVFAMQLLAGYHTMALFTLEAVGLMTLFFCFQKRSPVPAIRAFLAVLLGIGLAGIQLVPEIEFVRQTIRTYDLPYAWASYGAMTWESFKQLLNPFFFGNQFTYSGPPPNFIEHAAFVGRIGLGLAIFGAFASPVFLAIAVFGLWVSLGPNAPIDLQNILWNLVPVYHSLRLPPRHLVLFVFGAAALASYGLRLVKIRALQMIIAVLVTFEMVGFARHFIELRPIPEARQDQELLAILKKDDQPYRLLQNFGVWVSPRESFDFNASAPNRVFSATGYDPSILQSYYEFIDAAAGNVSSSILKQDVQVPYFAKYPKELDVLNIKYIMVPRLYDPLGGVSSGRFTLMRDDSSRDYRLYENKTVKPRFYFENDKEGKIDIRKYTPNEIVLATETTSAGLLVSSEVYYPGWQAYIDGEKKDIIKGNYAFRTLFVPAGNHVIRFYFFPLSFVFGLLVSGASAIVCATMTRCWRV